MLSSRRILFAAVIALSALTATSAAHAECKTLYYSVNDYGKEGPTRDAQNLLDKYIVKWAAEKGIKKYKVRKKETECELFLDFGVFDEHTCKASADVCW
ncbi:MAG: hypothetical protein HC850_04060 [Rhodomicrobium sp.]|nr:hypothetical protein [Rhodomicrobium sp.]